MIEIDADGFIQCEGTFELQGTRYGRSRLGGGIAEIRKQFDNWNCEFTGSRMAGNGIVMPFQNMCEGGNGNVIGFPEQFFPILQGHLDEGVQDHLIHPLLGIAEQEDKPDPF